MNENKGSMCRPFVTPDLIRGPLILRCQTGSRLVGRDDTGSFYVEFTFSSENLTGQQ